MRAGARQSWLPRDVAVSVDDFVDVHGASYARARYGGGVAGETDAGGGRSRALDEFLEARVAEGFRVEVHEDTHAIVVEGGGSFVSRLLGRRRRFVVEVDDHGIASMRPAVPVRH
jgi:hypothetical protein